MVYIVTRTLIILQIMLDDKIIVDITGSQFKHCTGLVEDVYVGEEIASYKNLDCKMKYNNYDITQDERLWEDYQVIL